MSLIKKTVLGSVMAATALVSATPAMARDYRDRGRDNTAVAVGAGILGVGLGVLLGSSNRNDRYNDGYNYDNGRWYEGYRYNDGYFYDRDGRRAYDRRQWNEHHRRDRDDDRDHDRGDRDGRYNSGYNNGGYYNGGYNNGYQGGYYARRGY
ncbi:hypothetical protein ACOYW6_01075 [Parablastomonas sp. CN1-191]|uniref:hypothetical protein n=1 Tax=Parablastomonas sp. CN1-191 TaxID=3400908 RepID=UPI003BF83203